VKIRVKNSAKEEFQFAENHQVRGRFKVKKEDIFLEPVLKPNVSRFSINFERLFGKILPLYSTYCKKFCQKTSQNLWKSEARWVLRQALIKTDIEFGFIVNEGDHRVYAIWLE